MIALVTGGAGFVGSHLTERLLAEGHTVYGLDDLSTGSISNIEPFKGLSRYHYQVGTVFNEPLVAELVDRADVVFHLAAAVGVMLIVEQPVRTIETNISGTEIVLAAAAKKQKKVFIFSTSEVYGKATKIPFNEDDDCVLGASTRSRWAYAASKLVDEFLALSYWREKKLPTVVVRLFNTVGPRQTGRYGMVIPRFVSQALAGGPITVYGDGTQSRCFGDVTDVVGALVRLAAEPKAVGEVFNIGNDQEITIQALAERVRDKVDPKVKIEHVPYARAYVEGFEDMPRRVPDLSKIHRLIGYRPTHDINSILDRIIAAQRTATTA
ncbi:MAG: GDP-mannose 4,6-dehydratase [Planctomycetes bacterium]|nr:GDP-mannose 4,6-dehydratase [Planctomycetota bacterium]